LRESVEGLLCGVLRLDHVEPKRASCLKHFRNIKSLSVKVKVL